jgi:biotin operon repressor
VTEAKLRSALQDLRPGRGPGGPKGPGHRGEKIAELAKDLGVSEAKLRTAFKNLRDDLMKRHDAERDAFAAKLAGKLGISEAKVKEVMDSLGHHGRRGP